MYITPTTTRPPDFSPVRKPKVTNRYTHCLLLLITPLILQACGIAPTFVAEEPVLSGPFFPVAQKDGRAVDYAVYQGDRQRCWKQARSENDLDMTESVNIMRFRNCLIKRGYLLMS